MKKGIIVGQKGEILGKEMIGQEVNIIEEKMSNFGSVELYYVVEFVSDEFKKYNNLQLAGGGYFNHIYASNIKITQ